jgi:hypothetical protein
MQQTLVRNFIAAAIAAPRHNPNSPDYPENWPDNQAAYCGNQCSMNVPKRHSQAKLSGRNKAG